MLRVLAVGWAVFIGYYVLRVTIWSAPDSCPDTVWEPSNDRRCDWTYGDVAWVASLPVLALATLGILIIFVVRRIYTPHAR